MRLTSFCAASARDTPTTLGWREAGYPGAALLDGELCPAVPRPFSRALR